MIIDPFQLLAAFVAAVLVLAWVRWWPAVGAFIRRHDEPITHRFSLRSLLFVVTAVALVLVVVGLILRRY